MSDGAPTGPLPTPDFDAGDGGLLPAVVQHAGTGEVRMLGYMDRSALEQTVDTGRVTFYSRSRERHWVKGESSGHWLEAVEVRMDCDGDALLVRALPHGPTCHRGDDSCFDGGRIWARPAAEGRRDERPPNPPSEPGRVTGDPADAVDREAGALGRVMGELSRVIAHRDRDRPEGSYTAHLLEGGTDRAARKVAEEALEVALAAVGGEPPDRQAEESADLLYHLLVLWRAADLDPGRVAGELTRRGRSGP